MKKILITFLLMASLLSVFTMNEPLTANATTSNVIQERINNLQSVYYTGTYFTGSGNPASDWDNPDNYYADSHIYNIPSRGGLPAGNTMGVSGTSCWAFAQYCFVYIYGTNFYNSQVVSSPSYGDAVALNNGTHYAIYLGEDANNYYVYDCNWDYVCGVRYYGAISKSNWRITTVYHAYNYDQLVPPTTYTTISEGTYYLKSNYNGNYLGVAYGVDDQGKNVHTYPFVEADYTRVYISAASSGYKIRPLCCSSRIVNAYGYTVESGNNVNIWDDTNESSEWWGFEAVSGGFVIRNMMNPSCVLTVAEGSDMYANIYVSTYTGASNQIWSLQSTVNFNANGGSGAPGMQLKNYGQNLTLSGTVPTRTGYTFLGWSTSASATSATYSAGGTFTPNTNTTLYAVWRNGCANNAHSYSNACDTSCNTCGATRSVTHTYSNACDASCNLCGATRTVGNHKYTNNCDPYCDYCGTYRTISHTYSNACDTSCNICGATRSVGGHKYSNTCDTACDYCGATRSITHTYTNSCDSTCNVCGVTRTASHSYQTTTTNATLSANGSVVTKCSLCGHVSNTTTISYVKTFSLSKTSFTYNGKAQTPKLTVKDASGKVLVKNVDYKVAAIKGGKTNVGTYTIKITMIGNYSGEKTLTYEIVPKAVNKSKCTFSLSATSFTYDGKAHTPKLTVKDAKGNVLIKNVDYTVAAIKGGKTKVGTYTIKVTMIGNYSGTKTITYKINPPKTSVSKLTAGTKSFTVDITKKTTQVTGYQVQYATNAKFTGAATKTIDSELTTRATYRTKYAKTYYVRVRTYKVVNGKTYYSAWSSYKTVRTK